jgi:Fe-S cluster biogenesis protein NfuA
MVQQSSSGRPSVRAATRGLRRALASRAEQLLDRLGLVEAKPKPPPSSTPMWAPVPAPVEVKASPLAAAVAAPAVAAAPAEVAPAGSMTFDAVQAMFDDMVRPALQSDGGDIVLREVVGGQVRVTLTGACQTCPSSIITMKQGIERLLVDEFPEFESLVQVDA